jgi:hypothetical protein
MITFICGTLGLSGIHYLNKIVYRPTAEEIFSRHLTYSDNTQLLQNATDIQAAILSMGQGVYLRFKADKKFVTEFLEYDQANPYSYHYPYVSISCHEFYEAYPNWADKWNGYEWWRPREVTAPECYVTRGCEYFLLDKESRTVYYYFFPDFLGKDYLCAENASENS